MLHTENTGLVISDGAKIGRIIETAKLFRIFLFINPIIFLFVFIAGKRRRRVDDKHLVVGQAVEVIDEAVDLGSDYVKQSPMSD